MMSFYWFMSNGLCYYSVNIVVLLPNIPVLVAARSKA